jgi:multisubunit Na+/H+ antiporter MnhG subunit
MARTAVHLASVARVGGMAVVMLSLAWAFLGDNFTSRTQLTTFGVAIVALAVVADAVIRAAVAPPPAFDERDEDE